jgi:Secretion system C-terminal sorting domain
VGDPSFALVATATSGLPVSYASSNTSVAFVSGNIVIVVGAGTATITASQSGDANYYVATNVFQNLTVNKGNQTIIFSKLEAKTVRSTLFTLSATATSGLAVSYASSNPLVATVAGNTVTVVGVGTTTITASQSGNANYNAAPDVTQSLTVINKANQTISFSAIPAKTVGDPSFTLSATVTSGLAVSFASSNPSVATVIGNTVTVVGIGTTTITASQSGNVNYNAAPDVAQSLTVNGLVTGIESMDESLKVFPSPVEDELVVDVKALRSASPVSLIIYDVTGSAIHTTSFRGDNVGIDVRAYQAGVYVLKVQTDKGLITKRIIKK